MDLRLLAMFPEWKPHFSFLANAAANELMALRWLHFIFGIIWIGLLYFFNFVLTPSMNVRDPAWVRATGIAVIVIAASWIVLALNGGENVSNQHLAISVGGGLGLVMLVNTWSVVWRVQKRLITWTRAAAEQGTPMPAEAERMMRWGFLTARVSMWLSFPMLFFMGAASHYPFLSTVAR